METVERKSMCRRRRATEGGDDVFSGGASIEDSSEALGQERDEEAIAVEMASGGEGVGVSRSGGGSWFKAMSEGGKGR